MSFFVAGGLWKTGTSKAWYFMIACLLTDCCSLQFSVLVKQLVECFWQNILDHIALLSWCWCKIVFFIFCYLSFLWPSYTFPFFYDKLLMFFFFFFFFELQSYILPAISFFFPLLHQNLELFYAYHITFSSHIFPAANFHRWMLVFKWDQSEVTFEGNFFIALCRFCC